MKKFEFKQIDSGDVMAIAKLLVHRQNIELISFPYLKNNKQNETYIIETLKELYSKSKIIGMGAYLDKKLFGYLFGIIKFDARRERYVWVPYEGIAIMESENEELIRHLYAEVSKLWLQYGCYKHYAMLPAGDNRYINAFQRLSFAYEQVHGILDIDKYRPLNTECKINVKIASKNDRDIVSSMSDIIFSFQNKSPTYAPTLPEMVASIRKGFESIVDDDTAIVFLAENNIEAVGYQVYYHLDSGLMVPEKGIELCIAGTYQSYMGLGVGKKIMNDAIRALKEKGYRYISSDWRITNLASSSFWKKCGFEVISHRMYRQIDERLAWANLNNPLIKCNE